MKHIQEVNIETFKVMKNELYTGVLSDILDELGYKNQVMNPSIRPITPGLKIAGRVFTLLAADVFSIPEEGKEYERELEALDKVGEGDVIVFCTSYSVSSGFWGELLSTAAVARGALGAVGDSYTRDSEKIMKLEFPLFTTGCYPTDSKGRNEVIDYSCPIECGSVFINPGDIIFGDNDGVVVIPNDIAIEVINKAFKKVKREDIVREKLLEGMSVVEAYARYRTL